MNKDYKFLVRNKSIGITTKWITHSRAGNSKSRHRYALSPYDYYARGTSTRIFYRVLWFTFVISYTIGGIFVPFKNPRAYRKTHARALCITKVDENPRIHPIDRHLDQRKRAKQSHLLERILSHGARRGTIYRQQI